eukprot:2558060-Prymnesium_polylepis.1
MERGGFGNVVSFARHRVEHAVDGYAQRGYMGHQHMGSRSKLPSSQHSSNNDRWRHRMRPCYQQHLGETT